MSLAQYPRRNACTAPAYRSLGKEMASQSKNDAVAPAGRASACSSVRPSEEVSQPQESAREPNRQKMDFQVRIKFGLAATLRRPPPSGRRGRARAGTRTVRPVRGSGAGSGQEAEIGS